MKRQEEGKALLLAFHRRLHAVLLFGSDAFCCCWRQIGIPDKCENVSKLRREACKVQEVNVAYLGFIMAIL